eukprot:Skav217915  [mRNA]  locus=scaffold795:269771:271357:- [translate_table: standard]
MSADWADDRWRQIEEKLTHVMNQVSDLKEKTEKNEVKFEKKVTDVAASVLEMLEDVQKNHSQLAEQLQRLQEEFEASQKGHDALQSKLDSNDSKISDVEGGLRKEMKIIRDDFERKLADLAPKLEDLKSQSEHVDRLTSQLDNLGNVYDDVKFLQGETLRLDGLCRRVSGFATRQVEWHVHIDDIRRSAGGDVPTSLFSPQFEAAGVSGLQLELRACSPSRSSGEEVSLYLYGPVGLQLVFKLFLGSEPEILCHTFDGKTPCGSKQTHSIHSILKQKTGDGLLHFRVQILESLAVFEKVHTEIDPIAAKPSVSTYGTLLMQNYLNNRLLELMQSRLRTRVDLTPPCMHRFKWRIEEPFLIQRQSVFSVRSLPFDAAGIRGMQLVFYPGGFPGARSGYCSVFVSCPITEPQRSWPRCWLGARQGSRLKAEPEEVRLQNFLGRLNFAELGTIIDPKDQSVDLVLEIEERQKDYEASGIHYERLDTEFPATMHGFHASVSPTGIKLPATERPLTQPPRGKQRGGQRVPMSR